MPKDYPGGEYELRIRSTYFKVRDMAAEVSFWRALLEAEPTKSSTHWSEFMVNGVRMGFLLNDFGEQLVGSSSVPVLEIDDEIQHELSGELAKLRPEEAVVLAFLRKRLEAQAAA